MKRLMLWLCVVGTVAPYSAFIPWVRDNGFDVARLLEQASHPIAAFAWLDVIISAVAVLALAASRIAQGRRSYWFVALGTCAVGVSLGLPLYLYLEQEHPSGIQE